MFSGGPGFAAASRPRPERVSYGIFLGATPTIGSTGARPGDRIFLYGSNSWYYSQAWAQQLNAGVNFQSGSSNWLITAADMSIALTSDGNRYAFFAVYRNVGAIVQRTGSSSSPVDGFAKHQLHCGLLAMQYQQTAHQNVLSVSSPWFQYLATAQNGNDGTSFGDRLTPPNGLYADNAAFVWSDPSLNPGGNLTIFELREQV